MTERIHHQPPTKNYARELPEDQDQGSERPRERAVDRTENVETREAPRTSQPVSKNFATPSGTGSRQGSGSNIAGGGGFPEVPQNPENQAYLQELMAHGYSDTVIRQMYEAHTGQSLSEEELAYLREGFAAFDGPYATSFKGYGTYTNPLARRYGASDLMKFFQDQQQTNDARDVARTARQQGEQERVKIHMILLQILMGDIVGALRSYAILMDRDMRQFTRMIVSKLDKVRQARSQVIRNFGTTKPPRAYAGKDPGTAARAQDRSAKYTQFVQMSTQLMNELQNTERELVDALQTQFRNIENFWQSYSSLRDEKFRTDEKVVTFR